MKNLAGLVATKSLIREPYAWPGGYPKFLIMTDGACLCHKCAKSEFRLICESALTDSRDGWNPYGEDINWETDSLYCDNCDGCIESAYGPEESDNG